MDVRSLMKSKSSSANTGICRGRATRSNARVQRVQNSAKKRGMYVEKRSSAGINSVKVTQTLRWSPTAAAAVRPSPQPAASPSAPSSPASLPGRRRPVPRQPPLSPSQGSRCHGLPASRQCLGIRTPSLQSSSSSYMQQAVTSRNINNSSIAHVLNSRTICNKNRASLLDLNPTTSKQSVFTTCHENNVKILTKHVGKALYDSDDNPSLWNAVNKTISALSVYKEYAKHKSSNPNTPLRIKGNENEDDKIFDFFVDLLESTLNDSRDSSKVTMEVDEHVFKRLNVNKDLAETNLSETTFLSNTDCESTEAHGSRSPDLYSHLDYVVDESKSTKYNTQYAGSHYSDERKPIRNMSMRRNSVKCRNKRHSNLLMLIQNQLEKEEPIFKAKKLYDSLKVMAKTKRIIDKDDDPMCGEFGHAQCKRRVVSAPNTILIPKEKRRRYRSKSPTSASPRRRRGAKKDVELKDLVSKDSLICLQICDERYIEQSISINKGNTSPQATSKVMPKKM